MIISFFRFPLCTSPTLFCLVAFEDDVEVKDAPNRGIRATSSRVWMQRGVGGDSKKCLGNRKRVAVCSLRHRNLSSYLWGWAWLERMDPEGCSGWRGRHMEEGIIAKTPRKCRFQMPMNNYLG